MSSLVAAADRHVLGFSERDARGAAEQATLQQQRKRARASAVRLEAAKASTAALEARVAALQLEVEHHASTHQQLASTLEGITGSRRWRWSAALGLLDAGIRGPDR